MMTKLPKVLLILLILGLLGNLILLDYQIFFKKDSRGVYLRPAALSEKPESQAEEELSLSLEEEPLLVPPGESQVVVQNSCGAACQLQITQEVARAMATISGQGKETIKETVVKETIQPTTAPQTYYLPLGSSASTQATSWSNVAGSDFIFDLADYGSKTEVHWQGNLKSQYTNSRCYARIYDLANSRAVDFSEQTWDQTAFETLTSQKLSIWQGKNNYRLQIKSLNGITCSLESPRLIIISQ